MAQKWSRARVLVVARLRRPRGGSVWFLLGSCFACLVCTLVLFVTSCCAPQFELTTAKMSYQLKFDTRTGSMKELVQWTRKIQRLAAMSGATLLSEDT